MPPVRRPGVFCLEGPWSNKLTDRSTVAPVMELLERTDAIRYAHRDAVTIPEFEHYLLQWSQKQYASYGFGYLAFHGEPGMLWVGRRKYTFEELAELLRGRLAGRVLYFGACSTMRLDIDEIERLRHTTGARAVCGYTTDVDSIEACAFELNLIYSVTYYQRIDAGFNYLMRNHEGECQRLGLRAVWKGGSVP